MVELVKDKWLFQLIRPDAQQVFLVGDFNGWSLDTMPMMRQGKAIWQCAVALLPGIHRFRYLADGQWLTDYAAFGVERNQFGDFDSVLLIHPPTRELIASPISTPRAKVARRMKLLRKKDTPCRRRRPPHPGRDADFFVPVEASLQRVALAAARQRRLAFSPPMDVDIQHMIECVMDAAVAE